MKGKGEKERYTRLNAEFQRIARRNKKAFISEQCEEIEENNRIGKTRDLFKKIRDTKEILHAKMAKRVLPKEHTGHGKHPLPTTEEKTLHMDITRWSTRKSD